MEDARPAVDGDLPRVQELARELRDEFASIRGGALWIATSAPAVALDTYADLLERDDALLVVGTIDAFVIGYGTVELISLVTGERLASIAELYVEPGARSVGVGEAMMEALASFALEHDAVGVDVVVLPGHRAAKSFFEEQGFAARAIVMHGPAASLRDHQ